MNNKSDKRIAVILFWCALILFIFFPMFRWAFQKRYLLGIVLTVIVDGIYVFLMKRKNLLKTKAERIIDRAIQEGTFATANRVGEIISYYESRGSIWEKKTGRPLHMAWKAKYEYIVDGMSYTRIIRFTDIPTDKVTVFYPAGKPHKTVCNGMEIIGTRLIFLMVVIPGIIAVVIMSLAGVIRLESLFPLRR